VHQGQWRDEVMSIHCTAASIPAFSLPVTSK